MSTFTQVGGFTQYHSVQHSNAPRYPSGVCGPFATQPQATAAMDRIAATFPATAFQIEHAGFAGNACHMLTTDHAKARQRLEQLRA
jgi:hypothetical protein